MNIKTDADTSATEKPQKVVHLKCLKCKIEFGMDYSENNLGQRTICTKNTCFKLAFPKCKSTGFLVKDYYIHGDVKYVAGVECLKCKVHFDMPVLEEPTRDAVIHNDDECFNLRPPCNCVEFEVLTRYHVSR